MRTQKEIRQRAPLLLIILLVGNLGLMSISAKDEATNQRMIRVWAQAGASLFQRPISTASGAGVGLFQRIANLRHAAAENEQLRRHISEMETELNEARAARDENERLRSLLGLKDELGYEIDRKSVV